MEAEWGWLCLLENLEGRGGGGDGGVGGGGGDGGRMHVMFEVNLIVTKQEGKHLIAIIGCWDGTQQDECVVEEKWCVCVYVCLLSECATQQLLNSEKTRVHGQQLITCYLTSAWCIMWCRYLLLLTAECPREEECVRVHVCVWVSDRLYLFSSQFLLVFSLVPSCCFQEAAFRMANGFPGRTPPQFLLGDNGRSAARAWCVCVCVCRFIPLVERPVCVFGEGVYFYFMSLQSWSNRTWEKALLCLDQWLILRLTPWF